MVRINLSMARAQVDQFVDIVKLNGFKTEVLGGDDGPMSVTVLVPDSEAELEPDEIPEPRNVC